jgi:hypothetical protein
MADQSMVDQKRDLTFFPDPNVDRLLGVVMELAGELYVLRDRMRTLEHVLAQKGVVTAEDLAGYAPSAEERAARLADRDALIERIAAPMTYTADSPAPAFEPV